MMRKCTGNITHEWEVGTISELQCPTCWTLIEFFKGETTRTCPKCRRIISNDRLSGFMKVEVQYRDRDRN